MLNSIKKRHLIGSVGIVTGPFLLLVRMAAMLIRVQVFAARIIGRGWLIAGRRA